MLPAVPRGTPEDRGQPTRRGATYFAGQAHGFSEGRARSSAAEATAEEGREALPHVKLLVGLGVARRPGRPGCRDGAASGPSADGASRGEFKQMGIVPDEKFIQQLFVVETNRLLDAGASCEGLAPGPDLRFVGPKVQLRQLVE